MLRVARRRRSVAALLSPPLLACTLAACTAGPDYSRPAAPVPTRFKELKPLAGWTLASPSDALNRGDWWTIYHDSKLDRLMRQVDVSNQNVAAQAAAYENARAMIRAAQSALFPTINANYSATRSNGGGFGGGGGGFGGGSGTGTGIGSSVQNLTGQTMPTGPTMLGSPNNMLTNMPMSPTGTPMSSAAAAGADPPAGGGTGSASGASGGAGTGGSGSGVSGGGSLGGSPQTTFVPELEAIWEPDVWGKVRRQIESSTAAAQMSAADLANVKLSEQALLATGYYNLRAADALYDLLGRTIAEYTRTLRVVQNQFNAGYSVTAGDVATAKAQVETTRAQQFNIRQQRAQFEHAIATLIGRPPAELTIGHDSLAGTIPKIPVTIPSTILERRPDIASAERTMQQQNALIGVAEAAFYPDISLSAAIEWIGKNPLPFSAANEIWSLGAAASEPLFTGGLRSAQLDSARAAYWQSVANYRQTVLTAFQGVEDQLAGIRYLRQALQVQDQAVRDARTAVNVFINQFQAGTVAFTTVVTAEIILLGDEQQALTYRQDLFLDSVLLIQNLGGTWDTTLLPTQKELRSSFSILPKLPIR